MVRDKNVNAVRKYSADMVVVGVRVFSSLVLVTLALNADVRVGVGGGVCVGVSVIVTLTVAVDLRLGTPSAFG